MRQTIRVVKRTGRLGMALLAAGAAIAGVVYATRDRIVSMATAVYRHGKRLVAVVSGDSL